MSNNLYEANHRQRNKAAGSAYSRHLVFEAYQALGFRCSDCGDLKPKQGFHVVHKQGLNAHKRLAAMLPNYLKLIATSAEIREQYMLLCKPCRAHHDASAS
jgi:hypothetical protein